ncbi:uncharacterized protein LOC130951992 isoform X2 [Arachis stenosperma]|uniref:uncharacterized protein LOC130951992 isoform X2 n=1 Tax=Arachis stenosperma TaxID=217475 RepID=UPI0025ACD807|nr:uncharacterized protein LOC130951992 isoform X2 [Arachis stenosperma]
MGKADRGRGEESETRERGVPVEVSRHHRGPPLPLRSAARAAAAVQEASASAHRRRRSSCRNLGVCPVIEEDRDEGEGAVNATEVVAVATVKSVMERNATMVKEPVTAAELTESHSIYSTLPCSISVVFSVSSKLLQVVVAVTGNRFVAAGTAIRAAIEAIDLVPIPPFFRPTITGIPLMPSGNC